MTSLILQEKKLPLNSVILALKSLMEFVQGCQSQFDYFESKGMNKSIIKEYTDSRKKQRKRKRQFDEGPSADANHSPREKFKLDFFLVIIDQLVNSLHKRIDAYAAIDKSSGFCQT